MKHLILCAAGVALAAVAASAPAQQRHSTQWRTKPAKEDGIRYAKDEASREFVNYARCVVDKRYGQARAYVLAPLGSPEQTRASRKVVRPDEDRCLKAGLDGLRMSFQGEVLAGGLAQALVLKEYPDLPTVIGGFQIDAADESARLAKLNAAEIFGRCVVQRDPAAALALFSSRPATPEERRAIGALHDDLGPCLAAGSKITINEMFLRNSMGVAAYRFAQQIQPRGQADGRGS